LNNNTDILIIGGGLAGLVNAIHLSKIGLHVILIEKNEYPKHKVCGEYISNEVLPYLQFLGADPMVLGAKRINRFMMSTVKGKTIEAKLPMGGFGVSRYTLDDFLFQKAKENGCIVIKAIVDKILYSDDQFEITTKDDQRFTAKVAIGAYGKRSNIDVNLNRPFIEKRSPYLGVKGHYKGSFPEDLVSLHNFKGGYCGVSKVENDHLNICYLADYQSFRRFKNIDAFQKEVLFQNPLLREVFENTEPVFQKPLTISQISFLPKNPVENHILMSGDAAGMIHPLCGNGMAMAIHSAKILSELIEQYFSGQIRTREALDLEYSKQWNRQFQKRLLAGRVFQTFFRMDALSEVMLFGLTLVPKLLPFFIRQTHGTPIVVEK
jgi:flavin-dependent dehydrogenase